MLPKLLLISLVPFLLVKCAKYHSNTELEKYLKNFAKTSTGDVKASVYSIGRTAKGNTLWVLNITAISRQKPGIPNIKFVGTIHGNEPVGRELLLYYMEFLRDNYHNNSEVRWLLDNTRIHFLPNMNPEGFAQASEGRCSGEHGRTNGKMNMDLNRNFPDYFHKLRMPEEAETKAVRRWMRNVPFVLSGGLHGGALVANYPFDTVKTRISQLVQPPSLSPDDDVFRHLASVYARNHPTMHQGHSCGDAVAFRGGITNGAAWYAFSGGMQDYNYAMEGCMEVTLEISCCKYPPAAQLRGLWEDNKVALLKYSLEALRGVTGLILDAGTSKPVPRASLEVTGRNITFYSRQSGEFWRLLLPGNYTLQVSADGYYDKTVPFEVNLFDDKLPQLTFLTVFLMNSSKITTTQSTTSEKQLTTSWTRQFSETTRDGAGVDLFTNVVVDILEQAQQKQIGDKTSSGRWNMFDFYLLTFLLLFKTVHFL